MQTMLLAEQLKIYREKMGFSQKELAEIIGVPQSAVARIESGENSITTTTLYKFCEALGLTVQLSSTETSIVPTSIQDVCDYILASCYNLLGEDYDVTNMKLNKLLYYSQMIALGKTGKSLFNEGLEAWKHGPVCREVYRTYSKYKANTIPPVIHGGQSLSIEKKRLIDITVKKFGTLSAYQLRQRTHDETPWINAWKDGTGDGNLISLEDIKNTYYDNINKENA